MEKTAKERIALLDVVRGMAVLGILLMNIRMFSEPAAAYFNPLAYGTHDGANQLWWQFQFLVADQKFMAIFSMLFGASTAIICDGLARRGEPVVGTYAKRIFGLLLIGLVHAYLMWSGDILVPYALASVLPFLARNWRWPYIAAAGIGLLSFGMLSSFGAYESISQLPAAVQASIGEEFWLPTDAALAAEVAAHQGAYSEHFALRLHHAFAFQTDIFLSWGLWRIGGLMLLGLALYRAGFLQGRLSARSYGLTALLALPLGFFLTLSGLTANEAAGWTFPFSFFLGNLWNYAGSVIVATGYIALFGFLLTGTSFRFGFQALTNVGKAALSNYLFQTVACITTFYGFGGGLFGQLERWETAFVVLGVWAVQLLLSHLWFQHRDKGPVEALWHRFTYARWLPARKSA